MIGIGLSLEQRANVQKWWEDGVVFEGDFVKNRYMASGSEISKTTFLDTTRASIAYAENQNGAFTAFAANQPRITDKGILIEPSATNIAPYAEPYQDISPYGAAYNGATRIDINWLGLFTKAVQMASDGSNDVFAHQNITYATGLHRVTLYVRASDGTALTPASDAVSGDFQVYVGGETITNIAQKLVDPTLGIYKINLTVDIAAAGAFYTGILQNSGQAGATLEWTGLQIETGEIATSPILTAGAIATRAADQINMDALATVFGVDGTLYYEAFHHSNTLAEATISLNGAGSDAMTIGPRFGGTAIGSLTVWARTSGQSTAFFNKPNVINNASPYKAALRIENDNYGLSVDGTSIAADTNAAVPAITGVLLGVDETYGQPMRGWIQRLVYFQDTKSNAELIALTTA